MIKKILSLIIILIFVSGLLYLIAPGPQAISDFKPLPNSIKSDLSGDTWQNPNNAAYYSDLRRKFVTEFYMDNFIKLHFLPLPPFKINHPPEEAFRYIRDQQESTYLEEYVYPLRESLFVNGYEPFDENGKPFNDKVIPIEVVDKIYFSKTTIRLYPSNVLWRVIIYIAVWLSAIFLFKLTKKSLFKKFND